MGWDEKKDVQRDAVYGSEGVSHLVNSRKRGRGIVTELRDLVKSGAAKEVSLWFQKSPVSIDNVRWSVRHAFQLLAQSKDELRK